jgi:hypothetical protein
MLFRTRQSKQGPLFTATRCKKRCGERAADVDTAAPQTEEPSILPYPLSAVKELQGCRCLQGESSERVHRPRAAPANRAGRRAGLDRAAKAAANHDIERHRSACNHRGPVAAVAGLAPWQSRRARWNEETKLAKGEHKFLWFVTPQLMNRTGATGSLSQRPSGQASGWPFALENLSYLRV